MVEEVCGVPQELFLRVAETLCRNSGRERTSAFCYAVGWTQHTVGVQYIRTAAIIQLLLGNIGRPGGGILALRGHASIQGSTDIPTLYNLLPGYLPMPKAEKDKPLTITCAYNSTDYGWWSEFPKYFVSLMKAWYGDAARKENGWCYDCLPLLTGDHSHMTTVADMADGKMKGYFVMGENPVVGSMNGPAATQGIAQARLAGGARFRSDRDGGFLAQRRGRSATISRPRFSSSRPPLTRRRTAASPTRSACCNGITRPSSRPAIAAANSTSCSSSGSGSKSCTRDRQMRRIGD